MFQIHKRNNRGNKNKCCYQPEWYNCIDLRNILTTKFEENQQSAISVYAICVNLECVDKNNVLI